MNSIADVVSTRVIRELPDDEEADLAIAWVAHELREPLVGLKAALETLGGSGSAQRDALLERCRAEVERLAILVNDTLRWGVAGESPRIGRCDLVQVVRESVEQLSFESGEDRVVVLAPERAYARADAVQLRSAIANLVRNALVYSPPGSSVGVIVSADDDSARVAVRNGGRPIPIEDRETIFLPFVRGANAGERFGKGLGLYIARRIAEANRGRLSVVSHDGTTEFRIELPGGRS